MSDTTTTGREYLRVSRDRTGVQRSPVEQHQDNARQAAARGVILLDPYAEPKAISASRYGARIRSGFGTLVKDLRSGRFGADELWLWESSRGSRKVSEWVELVEALEAARVKVYVTTHSRLYDPANPRDRRSLLEDAVDSEYESGKTSLRAKRAKAAAAADGRPNGQLGYGWATVHDPATGAKRYVINESEAAIIREMYQRVAAGHSLRAISQDLTARGIRTRSGSEWTIQRIRPALLKESHKAVRTHQPSWPEPGPVTRTPGQWPAIVDAALWDRVYGILASRTPTSPRPGRAVHLLSLIAVCDVCGCGIIASRSAGRSNSPNYRCASSGHIRISEPGLDSIAERVMLDYLARADVAESLANAAASGPELDTARTALADVNRELTELYVEVGAGRVSAGALAAIEPGMLARKTAAESRVGQLSTPPALSRLITPGKGADRQWAKLPMSAKREVARILLAPDVLGQLRVTRGGRWTPYEERVTFRRAGA